MEKINPKRPKNMLERCQKLDLIPQSTRLQFRMVAT
jgi:hypothetical protein